MTLVPDWLRVPLAVKYSGISRAKLYTYLATGEIKSFVLKKRFFGEFNGRGAAVRAESYAPLKHQSGINGLLPTYGGSPPFIPFVA